MREWRWEFKEIGQGHYSRDFKSAAIAAKRAALDNPHLSVLFEQFRPDRQELALLTCDEVEIFPCVGLTKHSFSV